MEAKEIIETLRNSECNDPFECPFGMFRKNKKGKWGCFAKFPNGNPEEPEQKCIIQQAADLIEELMKEKEGWTEWII